MLLLGKHNSNDRASSRKWPNRGLTLFPRKINSKQGEEAGIIDIIFRRGKIKLAMLQFVKDAQNRYLCVPGAFYFARGARTLHSLAAFLSQFMSLGASNVLNPGHANVNTT